MEETQQPDKRKETIEERTSVVAPNSNQTPNSTEQYVKLQYTGEILSRAEALQALAQKPREDVVKAEASLRELVQDSEHVSVTALRRVADGLGIRLEYLEKAIALYHPS